ncbi:hypothetical protein [Photobacterium atrarenae]|uniref:Chromosome partitioning protein ParA n=1 Tax=Photobacterium atrarenae TaxID=865757 RepID=A0ABY5GH48_9GAMM|nr:hypothetical protein [Photobacterium atrarenae]UTV28532.1 hypothetical protein NNL38_04600 [Photobacterium atrarenae]
MVSIQRLPTAIPATKKPVNQPERTAAAVQPAEPTVVAKAVAKTVADPALLQQAHANIQYDQPEGKHREALDSYLGVMHQSRRDALSDLVGVDVYV